jgi:hypothetical protein
MVLYTGRCLHIPVYGSSIARLTTIAGYASQVAHILTYTRPIMHATFPSTSRPPIRQRRSIPTSGRRIGSGDRNASHRILACLLPLAALLTSCGGGSSGSDTSGSTSGISSYLSTRYAQVESQLASDSNATLRQLASQGLLCSGNQASAMLQLKTISISTFTSDGVSVTL